MQIAINIFLCFITSAVKLPLYAPQSISVNSLVLSKRNDRLLKHVSVLRTSEKPKALKRTLFINLRIKILI